MDLLLMLLGIITDGDDLPDGPDTAPELPPRALPALLHLDFSFVLASQGLPGGGIGVFIHGPFEQIGRQLRFLYLNWWLRCLDRSMLAFGRRVRLDLALIDQLIL